MHRTLMLISAACLSALGLLEACGADDRGAPDPTTLLIARTDTASGDAQVAPAGTTLEQELRVVVTRDDLPVPDVRVIWATGEGSVTPVSTTTDANGISSARWTLEYLFAQQVASAALGGPAVFFTAIATPDPKARNTVLVLNDGGGNRFEPTELTIAVGDTVNWFWLEGSTGHNVVPDDGDSPPQSGPLVGYPKFHSYRFAYPGVYHYHCMAHGGVAGAGMSGTITVLEAPGPF
ncbi:MAG: plastocyanin/azurin family copper-binding protein [Gemmatimonadales bacterium]